MVLDGLKAESIHDFQLFCDLRHEGTSDTKYKTFLAIFDFLQLTQTVDTLEFHYVACRKWIHMLLKCVIVLHDRSKRLFLLSQLSTWWKKPITLTCVSSSKWLINIEVIIFIILTCIMSKQIIFKQKSVLYCEVFSSHHPHDQHPPS